MSSAVLSISSDSGLLKETLYEGSIVYQGERRKAIPREVFQVGEKVESVVFELSSFEKNKVLSFRDFLSMIPWFSFGALFVQAFWVFLWGVNQGYSLSVLSGGLAVLGALCFAISIHFLNDVEDFLNLSDLRHRKDEGRLLFRGVISASLLRKFAYFLLVLGAFLGLAAVLHSAKVLLPVGMIGAALVLSYSSAPFTLKNRPWGGLVLFLLAGPLLTLGVFEAFFQEFNRETLYFSLAFGVALTMRGFLQDLVRMEKDRHHGVRSLAVSVGFHSSRWVWLGFVGLLFSFAGLSASFTKYPYFFFAAVVVLSFPLVFRITKKLFVASGPNSALLSKLREDAKWFHLSIALIFCLTVLVEAMI